MREQRREARKPQHYIPSFTGNSYLYKQDAILPLDILVMMFPYLLPRDLMALSHASKSLLGALTMHVVVRSALMTGGNARKNMSILYTWMTQRVILPFSPARALKIACAWPTCEMCGGEHGTSRILRSPWCLIWCWRCIRKNKATLAFRKETRMYYSDPETFNDMLDHTRIAKKAYGYRSVLRGGHGKTVIRRSQVITHERERASRNNISEQWIELTNDEAIKEALHQKRALTEIGNWDRPHLWVYQVKDRINYLISKPMYNAYGEQIGPFMTHKDIIPLFERIKDSKERGIPTNMAVDTYLRYELGAPDHASPCYTNFINVYDDLLAEVHDREKRSKYARKMRQSVAKFSKMKKCDSIMEKIRDKVRSERAKQYVQWMINHELMRMERGYSQIPPLIVFDPWMRVRLNPILLAPTQTRFSLMVEIADEIDDRFIRGLFSMT